MKYVGIDLGTTNSSICSYDGETVRLYKSPDQADVTPSAIFIDRRGNKYLGQRAYDGAARNPDSAATRFKRMMGTGTPVKLSAVNVTMTPEQCSAEILKVCFGYLPDEIRNDPMTGTIITVPAAFNQMQKDATLSAAEIAGIGQVALMQEPVAAVMAVMRQRKGDGIFLVFDLGGGTLDVAIAESISGRVSLLSHGGVAMCGGTDFDRAILDSVVQPWLRKTFDLPEDLSVATKYKTLLRMCLWAGEKAKIVLSAKEETAISLSESELGVTDEAGAEIYVDIPFTRAELDRLIAPKLVEAIHSARETLGKAGLTPNDLERIVFVGGPTQYKPLRDKVSFELGIAPSTDVNPMTAVAEGAAVFAESIDWQSQSRSRKSARGTLSASGALDLTLNYIARTPDVKARVVVKLGTSASPGTEFQIDSLDTGWSSGRVVLKDGASVDVSLSKPGDNVFKIFVFDSKGGPVTLKQDRISITRTAASIDAIPASHSIGFEVREKLGGRVVLDYVVKEGESLPKKGRKTFRNEETLRAGSSGSLKFKVWEGDIADPITDNRFIGMFEIRGSDFDEGVIAPGAELICDYEVTDSGNIRFDVSVPSIGGQFQSKHNFYSRQDGQIDYSKSWKLVVNQAERTLRRLDDMKSKVDDPKLDLARSRVESAANIREGETDPEVTKQAMDNIQEAKRLLSMARKDHYREIRQVELDKTVEFFNFYVREHARPTEVAAYENLARTAQRAIDSGGGDFESRLDEMKSRGFQIMWRQDWWVVDRYKWLSQSAHLFADAKQHAALVHAGSEAITANDIENLRRVVAQMDMVRFEAGDDEDMLANSNIVRG